MEVDQITVTLRPRTTWEAIDLGFGLTRKWWATLVYCWLLTALPIFVIASVLLYQHPIIAGLVIWWFKPLYEQLPLHFISRAIFNQIPARKELRKALPTIARRQIIALLTWRRFSFNRAYTAPVALLEGLKGQARQKRLRILSRRSNDGSWLTIVCMHLELVLYLSLIILAWIFIPNQIDVELWAAENNLFVSWTVNLAYFAAIAVIAPFYVVSGFMLYLNRRTELEGWDIELAFRRVHARTPTKQHSGTSQSRTPPLAAIMLVLFCSTGAFYADAARCDEPVETHPAHIYVIANEDAKNMITEILDGEDFGERETITRWQLKEKPEFSKESMDSSSNEFLASFVNFFANSLYYLIWGAVVILVIIVLLRLQHWHKMMDLSHIKNKNNKQTGQQYAFGLEVSEASLPADIVSEARRLYQDGETRQALSLLYRGALAHLITHAGLIVRDSDTEGECVRHVESQNSHSAPYFAKLTHTWIRTAYGHIPPTQEEMRRLCEDWPVYFNGRNE